MRPERLEALLWDQIDGVIDDAHLAELETYLAEHYEARELKEELELLAGRLADLVEMEPPDELRPRIDRALAAVEPAKTSSSKIRPGPRSTFRPPTGICSSDTNERPTEQPGFVPSKGVSMASNKKGTIVLAKGLIVEVGAQATIPPEAWVIDGEGLTVYPGLIDAMGDLLRSRSTAP